MNRQNTITQRVKFLIKFIIGQGIADNQEDLGRKIGIKNKSQMSQLVNNYIPNGNFIDSLMKFAPKFNKQWLYDESIEYPFIEEEMQKIEIVEAGGIKMYGVSKEEAQEVIDALNAMVESLKKDVKYYSDMADSRLQTINVQNKLIETYENQLNK